MECRLFDFNVCDEKDENDNKQFMIQMFGICEDGKKVAIYVKDFKPFFFVKVSERWTNSLYKGFVRHLQEERRIRGIASTALIDRKTLYGFDAGKDHKFVQLNFESLAAFRGCRKLWYKGIPDTNSTWGKRYVLRSNGYIYRGTSTQIYESNIPPLLRYFHINKISPSGWVRVKKMKPLKRGRTTCDYECTLRSEDIVPLPDKETAVPLKICSFDIEASSSHGDFPLAKKTYMKLAMDLVNFWRDYEIEDEVDVFKGIIETAFGYDDIDGIHRVYPKEQPNKRDLSRKIQNILGIQMEGGETNTFQEKSNRTVFDILNEGGKEKLTELDAILDGNLPQLEGDKITFIGSSFMLAGCKDAYLNHSIALNTCDEVENIEIESYGTEEEVLLAWTEVIQRENPDIIIGYNIFGFDYKFMIDRACELGCKSEFMKLSRNRGETCQVKHTTIRIASGVHDLTYIDMCGRIPIDLYNYFRREYNLSSYKLDDVASHFIGDYVDHFESKGGQTIIHSSNLRGLRKGNYVIFEIIGNSSELYRGGKKFMVLSTTAKTFVIDNEIEIQGKIRWSLVKDDVTPQDIFRLSNGSSADRAIVGKYCIQDCMLVNHLLNKNDMLTGFSEIANICSIPISFVVLRGQGIKLLSFVGQKCREKDTLLPDVRKGQSGDGDEGAICLKPKCDLYLDNPIAVVDYGSLYPSSMISENISHDSKVWTKEYDLAGNLLKETGNDRYDHLKEYEYVDIQYDTYRWQRLREGGREIKTKVGAKTCRFAQFPGGKKAIMPSILVELLAARKATRKFIKYKTVTSATGEVVKGLVTKTDNGVIVTTETGEKRHIEDVESIEDTYDDFMKNIFDKRQLGYKITANSLYGQCGAKTSSFYDKDIAASTTATGRKLLLYAKRVIEEVYKNRVCDTAEGKVVTNADCIYGDSVTGDTPILLKHKKTGNICFKQMDDIGDIWVPYGGFKMGEEGRSHKEQCSVADYLVWTSKGWSTIHRLIRHKTNKKLYRITTHTGMVDVTEDHSLLDKNHRILKPKEAEIGMHLLHHYPSFGVSNISSHDLLNYDFARKSIEERNAFIHGEMHEDSVPVLNEAYNIRYAYFAGYYSSYLKRKCNSKIRLAELYYLANSIGFEVNSDIEKLKGHPCALRKMEYIGDSNNEFVYDIETETGDFNTGFPLIVKNTDSCFFTFNLTDLEGNKIRGKRALKITIELAQEAGALATKMLKHPHDLEYEKTFMPFCLISKKRYVGMLYETNPDKCKRKSMGIVLKRRDNAPIVKEIFGGAIDILMKEMDIQKSIDFVKNSLNDLLDGKYPMKKFIITKSLRGWYANPQQIAHKVLADRMGERDPGNKPSTGSRIPFAYIQTKKKEKLQGNRIETPTYIKENKLKLDYAHYITNQIMKPVQQVFALPFVLNNIPAFRRRAKRLNNSIEYLKQTLSEEKFKKKADDLRNKEVKELVFKESLRRAINSNQRSTMITSFFSR